MAGPWEPLRFDANISLLFTERPFLQRPAAAAGAGLAGVEMWWPFAGPEPTDREADDLVAAVADAGVSAVSLNIFEGDRQAGDRGLVSHPGSEQRFRTAARATIELAGRLGCPTVNALYGNRLDGVHVERQDETALENLAYAAGLAADRGITVVLEAVNPIDCPRYPINRVDQAIAVLDRVREASGRQLALLFDVYHTQRVTGNLIATIAAHADRFGHVQVADSPGRHEPGSGEIAFPRVLAALVESAYSGWVGLEYRPSTETSATLGWLSQTG